MLSVGMLSVNIIGLAHKYKTWKYVTDSDLHATEVFTVLKSLLEQALGIPWQNLVTWQPQESPGIPWQPLTGHASPYQPLSVLTSHYQPLAASDSSWHPLDSPGIPWHPMAPPGNPWQPRAYPGSP